METFALGPGHEREPECERGVATQRGLAPLRLKNVVHRGGGLMGLMFLPLT